MGILLIGQRIPRQLMRLIPRTPLLNPDRCNLLVQAGAPQLLLLRYDGRDLARGGLVRRAQLQRQLNRHVLMRLVLALLSLCDPLRGVAQHGLHAGVRLLVGQVDTLVRGARGRELQLHRVAPARRRRLVPGAVELGAGLRAQLLLGGLELALEAPSQLCLAVAHGALRLLRGLVGHLPRRLGRRKLPSELQAGHHVVRVLGERGRGVARGVIRGVAIV